MTTEEVKGILTQSQGTERLFLALLYGTRMRIAELQRLALKEVLPALFANLTTAKE